MIETFPFPLAQQQSKSLQIRLKLEDEIGLATIKSMATDIGRVSCSESGIEAQDTVPELIAADVQDPLCHLATNKDSKGVQGKWRLIIAIILCTLFMVHSTCPIYKA